MLMVEALAVRAEDAKGREAATQALLEFIELPSDSDFPAISEHFEQHGNPRAIRGAARRLDAPGSGLDAAARAEALLRVANAHRDAGAPKNGGATLIAELARRLESGDADVRQVTERVRACSYYSSKQVSRYRKHANFGC